MNILNRVVLMTHYSHMTLVPLLLLLIRVSGVAALRLDLITDVWIVLLNVINSRRIIIPIHTQFCLYWLTRILQLLLLILVYLRFHQVHLWTKMGYLLIYLLVSVKWCLLGTCRFDTDWTSSIFVFGAWRESLFVLLASGIWLSLIPVTRHWWSYDRV